MRDLKFHTLALGARGKTQFTSVHDTDSKFTEVPAGLDRRLVKLTRRRARDTTTTMRRGLRDDDDRKLEQRQRSFDRSSAAAIRSCSHACS